MFYYALETAGILLFLTVLRDSIKHVSKDPKKLGLLILSFIYITIFENINILLFAGKEGAYFYNSNFLIFIGHVPLFISLLWTVLLYTAFHLTDRIALTQRTKPFLDSLSVLLLSLLLSVAFARQGVITWTGYSAHHGWFGAPADHFVALLFMTFTFSYLFRYLTEADNEIINKSTRAIYYFLLPAFAYLTMLLLFSAVNAAEDILRITRAEELFILWALVILFALMLKKQTYTKALFKSDLRTTHTVLFVRMAVITYIIWSLVLGNIYKETIILPVLLVIIIFAELLLYYEAYEEPKIIDELSHY